MQISDQQSAGLFTYISSRTGPAFRFPGLFKMPPVLSYPEGPEASDYHNLILLFGRHAHAKSYTWLPIIFRAGFFEAAERVLTAAEITTLYLDVKTMARSMASTQGSYTIEDFQSELYALYVKALLRANWEPGYVTTSFLASQALAGCELPKDALEKMINVIAKDGNVLQKAMDVEKDNELKGILV